MPHQRVKLTLALLSLSLVVVLHRRKEPYYSSVKNEKKALAFLGAGVYSNARLICKMSFRFLLSSTSRWAVQMDCPALFVAMQV